MPAQEAHARPRFGRMRPEPQAAAWAAAVFLLALAISWWAGEAFRMLRLETARQDLAEDAARYATALSVGMRSRASFVDGLAAFVASREASGTLTRDAFDTFAAGEYALGASIRTIQVAPDAVIRWTYPLAGNEAAVGLDLRRHANLDVREDVARTLETTGPTVSGAFELAQGGLGIAVRRSVTAAGRAWGLAALVLDAPAVIEEAGLASPPAGTRYAVRDGRGRTFHGDDSVFTADAVTASAAMPEGAWLVAAVPSRGWDALVANEVTGVRILGLSIVALITLVAYLLASRQRRLARLVRERTSEIAASERKWKALFERSPVSLWEEDFSQVKLIMDEWKAAGVMDMRAHLSSHPEALDQLIGAIEVRSVNAATLDLYDAPDQARLLAGLSGYSTPESREVFVEQMEAVAEGRTEFWGDSAMVTPGGRFKYVAVRWTVMPGHERDYGSVVVSITDLTQRVRTQQELDAVRQNLEALVEMRTAELRQVNDELKEAQQAKDSFLANMSHELRTPLNSVLGFAGILLQEGAGPLTEEQRKQLEMVRRSGRQLLALVNDVLDLARVESGHVEIVEEEFDAGAFAVASVEEVRPLALEKAIALMATVPGVPLVITTDRERLHRIVLNLLSNAVKFTESGEVELTVRGSEATVEFVVRDTGPGIPLAERERIFEPFHQLPSESAAKSPGSGLGLAIARELAALLGGRLTVSGDERGAVFTLELPRRLDDGAIR
jgi:signal transduction histidine kinase/sensor domain CHASE-containing protein